MTRPVLLRLAAVVAVALLAGACVPHPVGPARTFGKYEGKATTTAKGALAQVQTALLAAKAASKGNGFGPYVAQLVAEAEDGVSGVQGTFDSIQPPKGNKADDLQSEVDQLLTDALEHLTEVRVAARRGQLKDLADVAKPLQDDADKLNQFLEAHK